MGYVSEKYLKDKPKAYFGFQILISVILILFFYFFFQTQCMDTFQMGYDYCRAELGEFEEINFTFYPNGSIENVTVTVPGLEYENIVDDF